MSRIYASSKKGQNLIARATRNEGFFLSDVYGRYSYEKEKSWDDCLEKCAKMHGYNFHICSHNTFQYSVAWETETAFYIETANNSYVVYKNW